MANPTATRWPLVFGSAADADSTVPRPADYGPLNQTLTALYDGECRGGLGSASA